MAYEVFPPPPELRPFVRFFWMFEGGPEGAEPYVYRAMADGCAELVFHYRGVFQEIVGDGGGERIPGPQALVHAQGARYRRFTTGTAFGIFGAHLYPFAVSHALRVRAGEVCGRMLDLDTLFSGAGRELEERVMTASSNAARVALVSDFLRRHLLRAPARDEAVLRGIACLVESDGSRPVAELAAGAHLSLRQYERKVKEYAGLSPKLLSRIARFQRAAARFGDAGLRSLTDIGLDCGYYDQSHFIRDFREFSGYHPGKFFSGGAEGTDYRAGA